MKRTIEMILMTLVIFLIAVFVSMTMTSCSIDDDDNREDIIWDIAPIELNFVVTDAQGNDLLDSTRTDHLLNDITVDYDGKTYKYMTMEEARHTQTRAYMASFYGLHESYQIGNYRSIAFGEFSGDENVELREMVLHIGKNTFRISYTNRFQWLSNGSPDINRKYYLEGKELTDSWGKYGNMVFSYTTDGKAVYMPVE